jgi:Cu/Zn superoxide dismutase
MFTARSVDYKMLKLRNFALMIHAHVDDCIKERSNILGIAIAKRWDLVAYDATGGLRNRRKA